LLGARWSSAGRNGRRGINGDGRGPKRILAAGRCVTHVGDFFGRSAKTTSDPGDGRIRPSKLVATVTGREASVGAVDAAAVSGWSETPASGQPHGVRPTPRRQRHLHRAAQSRGLRARRVAEPALSPERVAGGERLAERIARPGHVCQPVQRERTVARARTRRCAPRGKPDDQRLPFRTRAPR